MTFLSLLASFFDFFVFRARLGSKDPPGTENYRIWLPKWMILAFKMDPKSFQNDAQDSCFFKFRLRFLIDCLNHLTKTSIENYHFFLDFWIDVLMIWEPCWLRSDIFDSNHNFKIDRCLKTHSGLEESFQRGSGTKRCCGGVTLAWSICRSTPWWVLFGV